MSDFVDHLVPAEPRGPDTLAKERAQSSLPVKELANHLLNSDGSGFLERQERILQVVEKEKLFSKKNNLNLSRPDRYKVALARAKLVKRLAVRLGWDPEDHKMAEYLIDDVSPYMLHMSMFVTTIREQASEEQKAYWMPKIEKYEIIGAYAQTELGHGSNVKGIELQAKYDSKTKEFILHSPTLTASKWWNGTLGRTATHSIIVAQLLLPRQTTTSANEIEYVNYGPHAFMVQIRDQKTHRPFAGIAVGDIGAKYGYPGMDNAYMLFNNFKIPHSAFLSRYAKVNSETGAYTKPENPAVIYGSLTATRANIVMHARLVLARACTIAVRYLSIRRQFRDRDADGTGPEVAVLDYPTVQIRILPLLATTFALHYSGQSMKQLFEDTRKGISGGDFSKLADLHSMSSGLKSLCTTLAADGIEASRRALGGHGFGGGSGLIQLNNDYLSKPTVEGDNWMITQQTAAYIIKKVTAAIKAPDANATDDTDRNLKEYLRNSCYSGKDNNFDVLSNDQAIVNAFKRRAVHLSFKAHEERIVKKRSWNSLLIQLHKLSHAHSQSILVENFYTGITVNKTVPLAARTVLLDLFRLFALYTLDTNGREFFNSGAVSNDQLDRLPERIQELMMKIRPHAVNLVDSWMIPDYLLDSALGRSDGKVYEDLFNRAHRLNPLNEQTFNPYYWTDEIVMGSNDGKEVLAKL